ncbi:microtubule-associated tyrosine carboxypeptidase 1-like isoform X3 [Macaca nemestrina]|uniref:microtubule-associated tyrosine carboxypeptidase 1-like isoform X3 n=1 Tax=Macaca nemestrina TaxID=9545 RepID=UPI0039B98974
MVPAAVRAAAAEPHKGHLTSLHSVMFRKRLFLRCAVLLRYPTPSFCYTLRRTLRTSFRQLGQDVARYVQDADVRREHCVRAQRGQTESSPPVCFRQGQVYLDSIVSILRHRQTIDFPLLTSLGKGSYRESFIRVEILN